VPPPHRGRHTQDSQSHVKSFNKHTTGHASGHTLLNTRILTPDTRVSRTGFTARRTTIAVSHSRAQRGSSAYTICPYPTYIERPMETKRFGPDRQNRQADNPTAAVGNRLGWRGLGRRSPVPREHPPRARSKAYPHDMNHIITPSIFNGMEKNKNLYKTEALFCEVSIFSAITLPHKYTIIQE